MIKAYDDNGNVVDIVAWENAIYNKALADFRDELQIHSISNRDKGYTNGTLFFIDTLVVLEKLRKGM